MSKRLLVDLTEAQTWIEVVDRARREMIPEIGVVGTWALMSREGVSMDASEMVPPGGREIAVIQNHNPVSLLCGFQAFSHDSMCR